MRMLLLTVNFLGSFIRLMYLISVLNWEKVGKIEVHTIKKKLQIAIVFEAFGLFWMIFSMMLTRDYRLCAKQIQLTYKKTN